MFAPFAFMGGAAAIVQPDEISGLIAWYDFTDSATVTLSGTDVTGIDDKSSNGYDLTAGTSNYPTYYTSSGLNDLPYAETTDFTDRRLKMATTWPTSSRTQTMFGVVGFNDIDNYNHLIGGTTGNQPGVFFDRTLTPRSGVVTLNLADQPPYGAQWVLSPNLGEIYAMYGYGDGTNINASGYISGSWSTEDPHPQAGPVSAGTFALFSGQNFRGNGIIQEYFAYNRQLTTSEIDDMKAYLLDKYGL